MGRRGAAGTRTATFLALITFGLAACAAPVPQPPNAATSAPTPTPSSSPRPTVEQTTRPPSGDGRPLEAIPTVKPEGFAAPPPGSGLTRYTRQSLTWTDCGNQGLQCARVLAPLSYAKPDAQAITLALSRRRASVGPRLGSLFINPGGPGGSGVDYVAQFRHAGLDQYDIVGWDPRGVGESTPVTCFNGADFERYLKVDASPDSAKELEALIANERSFGRSCLERSGALLQHVSTTETVKDLDLLRALVGDARLTYFGSSYGTSIGALYAQLFPAMVGRMVLDGAVNITGDDSVSQAEGFERALGAFASWCATNNCGFGETKEDVLETITDFWQRLDERPLPAGQRQLTQNEGVTGVTYALYQPEAVFKYLAAALRLAIKEGDGSYVLFLADQYNDRAKDGSFGQANFGFPGVRCLDSRETSVEAAEKDWKRVQKNAPRFGAVAGLDLTCSSWPVAPAPRPPRITGEGAAPIVVIGTTGDPATPYEYAESMAQQLKSGVLVSLKGEGHLAYGQSSCIQSIVVDYLVAGRVPADGTRC